MSSLVCHGLIVAYQVVPVECDMRENRLGRDRYCNVFLLINNGLHKTGYKVTPLIFPKPMASVRPFGRVCLVMRSGVPSPCAGRTQYHRRSNPCTKFPNFPVARSSAARPSPASAWPCSAWPAARRKSQPPRKVRPAPTRRAPTPRAARASSVPSPFRRRSPTRPSRTSR